MKKNLFVLFVLALAVLAGLPAATEAQSRSRGGRYYEVRDAIYGRGIYDRGYPTRQGRYGYDQYYDQLIRLPGNMVACQMDFDNAGKVVGCHPLVKTVEFLEEHGYAHQNRNEMVGTTHVHEGKIHFRPYDDTNRRLGTLEAGALGGAGGAGIGGAVDGRRGATIGGVAGAIVGGVIASRNAHDNCLEIVGGVAKSVAEIDQPTNQQEASPVSRMEQGTRSNAIGPSANVTWPTVNTTDFRAVVTDPNTNQERLIPAGGSANLPEPAGEQPYTVVLLAPGRGSVDRVPGEIRPSHDLGGWDIVARR
ncbi:MAG: hypothetical protein A2816_00335 [Candidatus Yanofskybacteria bacterium RIFCSPHIGHO2_01_FULL_39_44]|nr:MAG: hypothetical protein A2816_00335 [Candidatus Yanofskybacteria bacterium RIFCSPHIGHO2_01_FULL_39_44]